MADQAKKQKSASSTPIVFDVAKAKTKAKAKGNVVVAPPPTNDDDDHHGHHRSKLSSVRWTCLCLAVVCSLTALLLLALSLTVLKVRDPTLSMESVQVRWFNVHLDAGSPPLRINATLSGTIAIRNPNLESMRFGASATEIFLLDVDGDGGAPGLVGVGRAPPGEVAARGESRVVADLDVFVDRVGPAVVGEVLFGGGEVRLASRTQLDGRVSVLGGMYGRRTVRVAMRCRVALSVSAAAVAVAGAPACVADFAR